MRLPQPGRLMWLLFLGFALSFAYGLTGALLIYATAGENAAREFAVLYVGPFNTFMALGLIAGTTLIVGLSQNVIPETIEDAFTTEELYHTDYHDNKVKFYSLRRTVVFASEFIILGFFILALCRFPLTSPGQEIMMLAGCLQWALASYVGRKLRYGGMMLHSLLKIPVSRNLFKTRTLDIINTSVHIASTLTVVFIYLHIRSYYYGPFMYDGFLGSSAQVLLLLPAILATPVLLIFNFFPREVLRRIYNKSIDVDIQEFKEALQGEALSPFEKKLRLLEIEKMHREELRYSLQLTLGDLPIGITILIMIAEPLIK